MEPGRDLEKFAMAGHHRQRARRARYPDAPLNHRIAHKVSSDHERPDQQCDEQIPCEEPIVTASPGDEAATSQNRVLTDEGNVPNRMKKVASNCRLRDVEQTEHDEGRVIARAIPLKA